MEKKFGILTFQNTINYGADLQLYALTFILKKMGTTPVVINYINQTIENREDPKLKNSLQPRSFFKTLFFKIITYRKRLEFARFKKDNFIFSKKYLKEFENITSEFNKVIVGSDQVWNTKLTGNDLNYFLYGVPCKIKKYSYAASFGVGSLEDLDSHSQIAQALKMFDCISVREKAGARIVEDLAKKDAEIVLDPTFLLTKKEWIKFSKKSKIKTNEKEYLLLYFIKNSRTLDYAKKYAAENNLSIKYISMRPFVGSKIETITNASPEDFIKLIIGAAAVIAGSYHGFILSLNLNIPVCVDFDYTKGNRNSRMESVINMFNIDNLGVDSINHKLVFFNNYDFLNKKLTDYRTSSLNFLEGVTQK